MTQTAAATKPVTLHHLEPGTLFRDRDALWKVCEGGDGDKIFAVRIASWNVNNTGEMMCCEPRKPAKRKAGRPCKDAPTESSRIENYNAYNEVKLVGGIYEVWAGPFRSEMFQPLLSTVRVETANGPRCFGNKPSVLRSTPQP